MKKKFFKKASAVLLAAVMLFGLMISAGAASYNFTAPTSPMEVDDNIITVAVHRAASVLPEVLGLNTKCGFSMINGTMPTTYTEAQTKLMLGAFGTNANESPNPYYYNYFYNFYAEANGKEVTQNALLVPAVNVAASPMAADTTIVDGYGTSISLAGRPDILIGCSSGNQCSDVSGYDALIAAIRNGDIGEEYYQNGDESYQPYLVSYTTTTTYDMVVTLNQVANVMNEITESTGKTGRYGDPTKIAEAFADYVSGVPTYILSQIEQGNAAKKSVAIVKSINADGTFTIAGNASTSMTSNNRIVEYLALVSDNIANQSEDKTVTKEELLTADAIVSGSTKDVSRSALADAIGDAELSSKVVIVEQPDTVYGITMNSIENGMGFGFYDAYLYSELLNPVEMCAYFYENFYHVTDSTALQSITSSTFNGVTLPEGMSTTLKDYNKSDISAKLAEGVSYYYNHSELHSTALAKVLGTSEGDGITSGSSQKYDTENDEVYKKQTVDLSGYTVELDATSYTYDGTEKTPAVTVKNGSEELTKDTDYTVSCTDNINAGTAAVTITGIGNYTGSITKTFTINKAANSITVSNTAITLNASASKAQTASIEAKATGGNLKYTSNNQNITVAGDGTVTVVKNYAGTAVITVSDDGDSNYAAASSKTVTVTVNQISDSITASNVTKSAKTSSQSFTLSVKKNGSGALTYSSSSKSVTVNANGKVTIAKNFAGSATITIKEAANGIYKATSKKITVTVNKINGTITASNVTKTTKTSSQSFTLSVKGSGALTYSSSSKSVTVNAKGKVTIAKNFTGKATITIKSAAKGIYKAASKKITITVKPAGVSLSSTSNVKGLKMTVKWKKNSNVTGYQIQYSTDKNFKSGVKTTTVTSAKTTSKTISSLKKGKKYYVRIRTYKTVSGTKYYSGWSTSKSVTISK